MNKDAAKRRRDNPKHRFYEVPDFRKFQKIEKFNGNQEIFEIRKIWLDEGALYESSVRKLG